MEVFKPVKLAYSTYEPATGVDETLAPIIYLHGMSALKEYWFDIPQNVADATKRTSYCIDARNHGDTEWTDYFNFDVNVDDLILFMDTLRIQKAVLVGHSMGGVTAIKMALKWSDRVESIVVEDMTVRKVSKTIIEHILTMVRLIRPTMEKAPPELSNDEVIRLVFKHVMDNAPPELKELMIKGHQEENISAMSVILKRDADGRAAFKCNVDVIEKTIADYDNLASEPEGVFDGPALFAYGTLSPFKVGEDEEHIKQFFPNAVLEAFDSDHSIHIPKPVEFTDAILKFLS